MSTARAEKAAPTKRELQGERSREEILDAAERLMSTRGYSGTSVSTLAKESGLPASSIYWHFGSKSGVLGAVMQRGATRFFQDATAVVSFRSRVPERRLAELFEVVFQRADNHPRFLNLFLLLLLGSEGEHAQDEVVGAVRHQGRLLLAAGINDAYLPWGADVAERVAERLSGLVIALFDGYYIANAAAITDRTESIEQLRRQIVVSVHAAAKNVRAVMASAAR